MPNRKGPANEIRYYDRKIENVDRQIRNEQSRSKTKVTELAARKRTYSEARAIFAKANPEIGYTKRGPGRPKGTNAYGKRTATKTRGRQKK